MWIESDYLLLDDNYYTTANITVHFKRVKKVLTGATAPPAVRAHGEFTMSLPLQLWDKTFQLCSTFFGSARLNFCYVTL